MMNYINFMNILYDALLPLCCITADNLATTQKLYSYIAIGYHTLFSHPVHHTFTINSYYNFCSSTVNLYQLITTYWTIAQ